MLGELFHEIVRNVPQQVAIRCGSAALTYSQLGTRAELRARALLDACASSAATEETNGEQAIALLLSNGIPFVELFWGAVIAGLPVLPLDPSMHIDALESVLELARPTLLVTDREGYEDVSRLGAGAPRVIDATSWRFSQANGSAPRGYVFSTPLAHSPAVYLWTSGSSGEPQRVCRTQEQLSNEARNFVSTAALGCDDHFLGVLPLHHSYGLEVCLLGAFMARATLVLLESYDTQGKRLRAPFVARCREVVSLIEAQAIRVLPGVPQQFLELATLPEDVPADFSGLKLVMSSASPLPRPVFERFMERFGKPVRQSYGSTEAGTVTLNIDPERFLQPESAGTAVHDVSIKVVDESGRTLPYREVGDILVRSRVVTRSARRDDPKASPSAEYFRSGDRGFLDEAGRLYVVGRASALIETGGYKVDPRRVEQVLLEHPAVRDVAVYAEPAEGLGQVIVAAVAAEADSDVKALTAFARDKLAPFETPRVIAILSAIPRGALGKVSLAEVQRAVRAQGALAAAAAGAVTNGAGAKDAEPALGQADSPGALLAEIREDPDAPGVLLARIQAKVAALLGLDIAKVPATGQLQDIGFDSVRATEFRAWLERGLGFHVPITVIWNSPTLLACAEALLRIARAEQAAEQRSDAGSLAREHTVPATTEILERIDALEQLNDFEIFNRLLAGNSLDASGWRR